MAVYNSGASNQVFIRRAVTGISAGTSAPPPPTTGQIWPRPKQ